jgi:transposase
MHIAEKNIEGRRYYYLQHSYRSKDHKTGRGKVKTRSVYLGKADNILERLNQSKRPLEVEHKEFGFVAALVQVSRDIGLIELLKERFKGERFGVPRWLYFYLTIINRLQHATSKEQMGTWTEKTILPELFDFDTRALNSQSFWYATEDVVSEAELQAVRAAKSVLGDALTTGVINDDDLQMASEALNNTVSEDQLSSIKGLLTNGISEHNRKAAKEAKSKLSNNLFVGIDESVFHDIVEQLFDKIKAKFGIPESAVLYDTTNFFTYIDEPSQSVLAKTGHSKESRHHLRQIGLALAVDKCYGMPFFYRVYRGNSHDSKTFGAVVDTLVEKIKATFGDVADLVLILDKGNNSKENFKHLKGKVKWVGSLVPSQYPDLFKQDITAYDGEYDDIFYFATKKNIMGTDCLVISTYRPSLARKQAYTHCAGLVELTNALQDKFDAYKERPADSVPAGMKTMLSNSRYGKFMDLQVQNGQLTFVPKPSEFEQAKQRFGKNILFTDDPNADATWVIANYQGKNKIEDCFKLVKGADLIRFRPIRHFTDTKICAFAFCCVVSLMLMKVVELLCTQSGLHMSPALIKEELTDIKAVTLIYGPKSVSTEITRRSTVQQKLWDLLRLGEVSAQIPYTS